jgi:hypothetical protein
MGLSVEDQKTNSKNINGKNETLFSIHVDSKRRETDSFIGAQRPKAPTTGATRSHVMKILPSLDLMH